VRFAWLELVARQPERANTIGWLRVVARREAIRLVRADRRTAALPPQRADPRTGTAGLRAVVAADALRVLAGLPARKRSVLSLQVSGYSCREIAARLQMTPRTVEREVLRARAAARARHHAADVAA
jgi:RNA polymerase sigma factor (sigma-70 family)